jgi:hypothetical protein|tara:strand:- start:185 stop:400 length:216 start_codon:yes stop_codon:yes gene_type:complete
MADLNLDPFTLQTLKVHINKEINAVKDHICQGVDTLEKLQYSRGRLNAYEALLQDFKNLQKENIDGDTNKT